MTSLIAPGDTLVLWAVIMAVTALAITAEHNLKWAGRLGSTILCIFLGFALANLRIIPFESPVYSGISSVLLPLAIPLLLFRADLRRIIRESGRMFIIYNISAVAAVTGVVIIALSFRNTANIAEFAAMSSAALVGGTVNAVAMSQIFAVPLDQLFALSIVGNLYLGFMIVFFVQLYRTKFCKKHFIQAYVEEPDDGSKTEAAAFWKSKGISIKDIAQAMAITFVIVGVSQLIARTVNATQPPFIIQQVFGNIFLLFTILTTAAATFLPKFMGNIKGSDELGSIMMLMWFTTIGSTADIARIVQVGGLVIITYTLVVGVSLLFVFGIGKLLKVDSESMFTCITACIGGPPTVAAICVSARWRNWIAPGILCALYGVIIGNFVGITVGNFFGALPFGTP